MNITIHPSTLSGTIRAISSKSMAHRLMILNALSETAGDLVCTTSSQDLLATQGCLESLANGTEPIVLDCGESGSTLRFLLPVIGALGKEARIIRRGRLSKRPLAPFDDQLRAHGMSIEEEGADLTVKGTLHGGRFTLPGDISSQYISGILLAAPILDSTTELFVSSPVQSRPYIDLTVSALSTFGVTVAMDHVGMSTATCERFALNPAPLRAPSHIEVEGDWSNAAFWLAAGAMEDDGIVVDGLDLGSLQGDRAILGALAAFGARIARKDRAARATRDHYRASSLDVGAVPDLVPPLAAVAVLAPGTSRLHNAGRLRLKESDRLAAISAVIEALGGNARVEGDDLVIQGVDHLEGGIVDAANDHRIAMMAAIMATHATGPVTIHGAECVAKSYPDFWNDYRYLGGNAT